MQDRDGTRPDDTAEGRAAPPSGAQGDRDTEAVPDTPETLKQELRDLTERLDALSVELAGTRSKPLRAAGELLLHKILSFLARQTPPLPTKIAMRAQKGALKHHPLRSLPGGVPAAARDDAGNASRLAASAQGRAALSPDPARRTILLVTHEASRTGAPILALNIARVLSDRYNVVTLTLGGGPLRGAFGAVSTAMYELERRAMDTARISGVVKAICERHDFAFALINSAESRGVLPGLKAADVASTILLHEFASYTRPRSAFADIFANADQVIFSTRITMENALETIGVARGTGLLVLPQGKCEVPGEGASAAEEAKERAWLDSVMRPGDTGDEREFVVLGAGTVETRKGVDLFLECATRVIRSPGGGRFRFVWIGHGYRPDKDKLDSAFLADQIARAGIGAQVSIVRATSQIEHAYRQADALLLSSRLDPLPNVAIDALVAGTPVLCFEHTTGIADFLIETGLRDSNVAPYLDCSAMAARILALAGDAALRERVIREGQAAALRRFDMDSYVARLEAIASGVVPAAGQIRQDAAYLAAEGSFRPDFFNPPQSAQASADDSIRRYLEASRSGRDMRKPAPGFHPLVFAAAHQQDPGPDPYVRFLKAGAPAGPWSCPVIDDRSAARADATAGLRIALHLHVDRPDLTADIIARLRRNVVRPAVVVSTTAAHEAQTRAALDDPELREVPLHVLPARGGAIGALLTGLGAELAADHDIIGHVCTTAPGAADMTDFAIENLLGGATGGAMVDRILTAMADRPDLGIVYPDDPRIAGWGRSRAAADHLARRLGLGRLPDQIDYPTCGMFWVHAPLIRRLLALELGWSDYSALGEGETTLQEALLRLLVVLPRLDGLEAGVTHVRGLT